MNYYVLSKISSYEGIKSENCSIKSRNLFQGPRRQIKTNLNQVSTGSSEVGDSSIINDLPEDQVKNLVLLERI